MQEGEAAAAARSSSSGLPSPVSAAAGARSSTIRAAPPRRRLAAPPLPRRCRLFLFLLLLLLQVGRLLGHGARLTLGVGRRQRGLQAPRRSVAGEEAVGALPPLRAVPAVAVRVAAVRIELADLDEGSPHAPHPGALRAAEGGERQSPRHPRPRARHWWHFPRACGSGRVSVLGLRLAGELARGSSCLDEDARGLQQGRARMRALLRAGTARASPPHL